MKKFMDEDFLLNSNTAKKLYNDYSKDLPVIDYHCHINPKDIAKDKNYKTITELWLKKDHYKWRFMRSFGIGEYYITGDADDFEKFQKWSECIERGIGNPLYHWTHLELKRYFNYHGVLNSKTAKEVYEICNEVLNKGLSVKKIIEKSNVKIICTTDDPTDSLIWHKIIKEDKEFTTKVYPALRPDNALNINNPDYIEYIEKLSKVSEVNIGNYDDLINALIKRIDYFSENGCKVSDHALSYIMFNPVTKKELIELFNKRMLGNLLEKEEENKFKTGIMLNLAGEYKKRNWVMQLHFGCKRDNNSIKYHKLGPDSGYDCINNYSTASELTDFLNVLESKDKLPKTILYSLNPNDNEMIGTIMGCFQDSSAVGKIQHGSAWWFNDHKDGIINHLKSVSSLGNLSGFIGMLTDSRSFLSYTRHEYFRRILCDFIGDLVEKGEFYEDYSVLEKIIEDISFYNAKRYFEFENDDEEKKL